MATRNNAMIRRDIKRLVALIEEKGSSIPALAVLSEDVKNHASRVDKAWKDFQAVSVRGDRERDERDAAVADLASWIKNWRPVILIKVPGADKNLKALPAKGATPDDTVTLAEDMIDFMKTEPNAAPFCEQAIADLGNRLVIAGEELKQAVDVLPQEKSASDAFTEACAEANPVLVRGLGIVRSAFGPTSREYKQFIARVSDNGDGEKEGEQDEGSEVPSAAAAK